MARHGGPRQGRSAHLSRHLGWLSSSSGSGSMPCSRKLRRHRRPRAYRRQPRLLAKCPAQRSWGSSRSRARHHGYHVPGGFRGVWEGTGAEIDARLAAHNPEVLWTDNGLGAGLRSTLTPSEARAHFMALSTVTGTRQHAASMERGRDYPGRGHPNRYFLDFPVTLGLSLTP